MISNLQEATIVPNGVVVKGKCSTTSYGYNLLPKVDCTLCGGKKTFMSSGKILLCSFAK
jgi:hypothetical protein